MSVENKKYEKPALRFVSLRNQEAVADTCWGYHDSGKNLYFDTEGAGYVSFQITGGSCSLSLSNVLYYEDSNATGRELTEDELSSLSSQLANAGGNDGQPFKGQSSVVFENPQSEWS